MSPVEAITDPPAPVPHEDPSAARTDMSPPSQTEMAPGDTIAAPPATDLTGIDPVALTARVRESGIAPQTLIDLERSPRHYRIWLE